MLLLFRSANPSTTRSPIQPRPVFGDPFTNHEPASSCPGLTLVCRQKLASHPLPNTFHFLFRSMRGNPESAQGIVGPRVTGSSRNVSTHRGRQKTTRRAPSLIRANRLSSGISRSHVRQLTGGPF